MPLTYRLATQRSDASGRQNPLLRRPAVGDNAAMEAEPAAKLNK
jgi:hypothetical protein